MLIIQHFAHDYFSHKFEENYIGLSFNIKGKYNGDLDVFAPYKPKIIIHEGFICIKKLELNAGGANETSRFKKNLDIEFNEVKKVYFDKYDDSEDFFINIPEGHYDRLGFGIHLSDHLDNPSVFITASYYSSACKLIPVTIELFGAKPRFDLEMNTDNSPMLSFTSDRTINPSIIFEINASKWLDTLSIDDLENAQKVEDSILINDKHNRHLYFKLAAEIHKGDEIYVELR
ncbi:hypothetical protein M3O96_19070 [Aquiflexum sp. TKW24L]|uniref:hypothetical protein n=1 Tax=Aquiflexum sp. TKW24L TaxID=2942212 RepID=UPI0020BF49FA|nr:hypothetical protein [Aquiflexum sp. TKW24L]MCL6261211.1 hypothetical protein [Aquiflexum sp. TKW24L]